MDAGRINAAFDQAIARCEHDCRDRPALRNKRTVLLKIDITPEIGDDGNLDSVNFEIHFDDKQPRKTTRRYNAAVTRNGIFYNDLSMDDVHQATLDEDLERRPKEVSDAS